MNKMMDSLMRYLVLVAVFVALMVGPARAFSFADLRNDIYDHSRVTVLQSAVPSHFYNMRKGRSEGGFTTQLFAYRFISGDLGFTTPFHAGFQGTVLAGGSIHIDQLIAESFPTFTEISRAFIPDSVRGFWNRLTIGVYAGHNLDDRDLDFGLQSGLEFKF